MADFMTRAQRSRHMSLIRSKDTKPELRMAEILESAGISHVRHPKIYGTPDFLLDDAIIVQVDGEFWHGRNFRQIEHKLSPYWKNKIKGNMRRDVRTDRRLRRMGFSVIRIWETDLKNPAKCLARIRSVMDKRSRELARDRPFSYMPVT